MAVGGAAAAACGAAAVVRGAAAAVRGAAAVTTRSTYLLLISSASLYSLIICITGSRYLSPDQSPDLSHDYLPDFTIISILSSYTTITHKIDLLKQFYPFPDIVLTLLIPSHFDSPSNDSFTR